MTEERPINFESSLRNLEKLVNQLEQGDLSLEESLKAFEAGVKLTRECNRHLDEAEQKINLLIGEGNDLHLTDFQHNNGEDAINGEDTVNKG